MSVLETISGILEELKCLNLSVEDLHHKLDRLLASKSNPIMGDGIPADARFPAEPMKTTRIHSPGFEDYKPEIKEEVDMDFSKVLVMNQTDKALLVVKKGYQQWLAKSLIAGGGDGYDNGTTFDIPILEISPKSKKPTKWVFKKWEKFKVVKN